MSYADVQSAPLGSSAAVLAEQGLVTTLPSQATIERISALEGLKPGWNGHRAPAVSARALFNAKRIAQYLPSLDTIAVVPTNRGGVQLEWHGDGLDVEIEVHSDGSATCLVEDESHMLDADGLLGANWKTIHQALRRIG